MIFYVFYLTLLGFSLALAKSNPKRSSSTNTPKLDRETLLKLEKEMVTTYPELNGIVYDVGEMIVQQDPRFFIRSKGLSNTGVELVYCGKQGVYSAAFFTDYGKL